jgi:hypothetical protein
MRSSVGNGSFDTFPSITAKNVFHSVPTEFAACMTEPAFVISDATFCICRYNADAVWKHSPDLRSTSAPDGSAELLRWLDGNPATDASWAQDYYERHIPIELVQRAYLHEPLDVAANFANSPEWDAPSLGAELKEIGYP